MKSTKEQWTVVDQTMDPPEDGPREFDRAIDGLRYHSRMSVVLRCTTPARNGIAYFVHGHMETTWWENSTRVWRLPWSFVMGNRVEIVFDGPPTSDMVKRSGIAALHRAVKAYYLNLARHEGSPYGPALSLPSPGQRGHTDRYYAIEVQTYLDAIAAHGRGYMSKLLAEHPGETKSNFLRKINRAESLGLVVLHREPGKLTRGEMTDLCRQLLNGPDSGSQESEKQ